MRYQRLDHTADIGVRAFGRTPAALFQNAALGMLEIWIDPRRVRLSKTVKLHATGANLEDLLVGWLSEILYQVSARKMLLKKFEFQAMTPTQVRAVGWGERIDPKRHAIQKEIKAVTYHGLMIRKNREGMLTAQVIFDI